MSEKEAGYIELSEPAINAAIERRNAVDRLCRYCVDLITDFAYFDDEVEGGLVMPVVQWDDDKTLLGLWLMDAYEAGIGKEDLENIDPRAAWVKVGEIELQLYPKSEDMIVAATLTKNSDRGMLFEALDVTGTPLATAEVEALTRDLERYRDLVREGKLEPLATDA